MLRWAGQDEVAPRAVGDDGAGEEVRDELPRTSADQVDERCGQIFRVGAAGHAPRRAALYSAGPLAARVVGEDELAHAGIPFVECPAVQEIRF